HLQAGNSAVQIANRLAAVALDGPPSAQEPPSASLRKQLVGVYQAEKANGGLTVTVGERTDGVTLRLPMKEPLALVPAGRLRFALRDLGDDFFARFALEGGRVASLTLEPGKGRPAVVLRPAKGLANAVKDFDRGTAGKVAGKVWLGKLPATPGGKEVLRFAF